ncbi:poly [ADP-ribose] polymerase tankyrase [Aplysia californica]|uniref:Poly [ADP-ribose] polymerase n=1 Tax=Aplysia californica TaxID=6500 RepID=A0ABM1AD81_APLCA|nr:poly [ADP-ribose] polymerase tankyrase [Aplysia californica]
MASKDDKAGEAAMATTSSEEKAPASGSKRKARQIEVEPRTPLKRQRVPVSRFQSPLEELEPRFKPEKEDKKKDDVVTLYKKNTFLAVRGAEGSFYLCRTAQNIYSTTKRLRIQWLSLEKSPDLYKFDYVDSTELETVLTEITMDKVSKTSYKLPASEQKRAEKILDRAIRVEQGMATADEVEEEALEEIEEEEEEEEPSDEEDDEPPKKQGRSARKTPNKGGRSKASTPASKKKEKEAAKRQKAKEKAKASKQKDKKERKKGPDRNLKPNGKIRILEKDPFFETKDKVPKISPQVTTKLIFRAVNMGDVDALKDLLNRTEGVCPFEILRSVDNEENALQVAGELGRKEMVGLLTDEFFNRKLAQQRKRKHPPAPVISSMSTGEYNPVYLGIQNIRALKVSRGNKEGNEAFLKDRGGSYCNASDVVKQWMSQGVSVDVMESFFLAYSVAEETTRDEELYMAIDEINTAVKRGHRRLAAKYVAEAERLSGYGFNFLHKEVLNFEKEDLRDIILAASVRKKPFSNDAVTPLHCAAINPNVKYLRRLLSIEPDINIQTRSRARPIHYAAVCEGTGPLDFLLERHASPSEADSSGELPIHWAARSGRHKNIDVLIKHAKSDAMGGVVNEKWGVGNVNRPNRFSECPLHIAVQAGHLDTVRTLIKHGADVNKQLSAGKGKVTPLMLASQAGSLNMARVLVQSGAAVEIVDKMKRSALTHAIINGSSTVASYLLYLGADPNRLDSSNNSLVHYASAYGWYFCLKLLLKDAGANPDLPNDWQTTPVNIAFLKDNMGIVEMLINHKGVNIDFKTDAGLTLPSIVCQNRIMEGLEVKLGALINNYRADPTIVDTNGCNALHHLAANNIKLKGEHWNPQVDLEAMKITVKMAEVLIGAGCDPRLRTNDGKTPIMLAIEQVNVELVEYLVQQGGTVSSDKNTDEKTVLHLMAEQCCATDLTPMLKILAEPPRTVVAEQSKVAAPSGPKENGKVNAQPLEQKEAEPMEVDTPTGTEKPAPAADGEAEAKAVAANSINGEGNEAVKEDKGEKQPDASGDAPAAAGTAGTAENSGDKKPAAETPTSTAAPPAAPTPTTASAPSQEETLRKMAKDRDFLGFTPLLRACQVYSTFNPNQRGARDSFKAQNALNFIQALVELTGSDVNATVGPKNMPEEPELHYAPEGKNSALHFMINPACETEKASMGSGLRLLLRFKPDTNQRDQKGKTPLILAVETEKESIVKALLEAGADPNVAMAIGQAQVSVLLLAAQRNSLGIMKLLIDFKADVKSCHSETLQTPVHSMVMNRVREDETIAMIQTLLQAGADLNAVDREGDTPLHIAVRSNKGHSDASTSLEEFLLDRGADVFAKNKSLLMPLHIALDKSQVDPIELCSLLTSFMRDQRVDEPTQRGFTPLLYAACSGATICCMHLLQRNANIEAKEFRGNTPINLAVHLGHDSCAIMLMQRHASLSHPIVVSLPEKLEEKKNQAEEEKKRKRPVMLWRPRKQWECARPKEWPGETMTLFEGAVKNDLTGVAHMLLDALGMPMEAVEAALNLSKFNLALRLLRRIPDVSRLHALNKDGQNLFHVLALKTNRNSPDLQTKVAGALLEKRLPLGEKDGRGLTPLMYAVLKHQSVALGKFLIQNDLQYNPKVRDNLDRDIMAAFMWDYSWVSDKFKTEEVREWLEVLTTRGRVSLDTLYDHPLPDPLLLGASVDLRQPDYFETRGGHRTTPLIFAIRNYDFGLAKFMLQKGASPNFPDSHGLTPMIHAVQMNDVKMVKLLLNYDYDLDSDSTLTSDQANLKPQLSKEQSRQVLNINFATSREKNPDDLLDEEVEPAEDDAVSLSKHTEENEDSVDLNDGEDEEDVVENEDILDQEDEEGEEEKSETEENQEEDAEDSDHDTDVAEDEDPELEKAAPLGAKKLSLSRHVSQMTKEREYKSIEKTSPVDLSVSDKNGWTATHHAVCSLEQATFDNAEIVFLLGKAGAPLEAKNNAGETAMDLARRTDAPKIVKVLNRLLAAEPYSKPAQAFDSSPSPFVVKEPLADKVKPDFRVDSEQMLDKLDTAAGARELMAGPKPDSNCKIKKTGEVASHPTTNIPYDVTLSKVDVSVGVWGMYNFYKLQIVRHTAKNLFVLFTRWGRIGSRGQYQHTPFQSLAEAAKEFCKIYKSKTANDWYQTTKFQNHPKKYRLMPRVEKQRLKHHKVELSLDTSLASGLPEAVLDLVTEISNVSMFEASINKVGLDTELMPFGRMNRETLLEARRVLTDISELIDKATKLRNNLTTQLHAEYQAICEEISQLTNEYYHLVPQYGFEYNTIRPISEKKTLRDHTKVLGELMDIQVANTILLAANLRKTDVHPMDYVYRSLSCSIQPLSEDHPEAQFVLTNIHASVPSVTINRMFKVAREGEDQRLAALSLPNHQLLWHGSSMANFLSILSRGLLVTPPEVPWTGHLFGEGIYFADTFLKSSHYCHNHSPKSSVKVMLLCEVALGNPKIDVKHGDEDHLDDDINSLKILGRMAPNSDFDARLPFGSSLSLGQVQQMVYHPPASIQHNEYIVHNADQVAIRYLVMYNG